MRFDHPEKFRDASLDSHEYEHGADAYVINTLTRYLQKLGQRYQQPDQQAQERVSDKMHLSRPGRLASSSDCLYAEKAMLNDGFRQRFAAPPAS